MRHEIKVSISKIKGLSKIGTISFVRNLKIQSNLYEIEKN